MKDKIKKTIIINVELIKDKTIGGYTIYSEEVPGIIAEGKTIKEAKKEFMIALEVICKYKNSLFNPISELIKKYSLKRLVIRELIFKSDGDCDKELAINRFISEFINDLRQIK
jgi:predicted RNase H-like HicB family nuclease